MFIGVDIGGTHLRTALVDGSGKILVRRRTKTEIRLGPEHASRKLAEECEALVREAERLGGRVASVGLGVAGKIDPRRGLVVFSPNLPSMRDYPLGGELHERLKLPVVMENDANVFGLGEGWVGSARGIGNWIGVTLGTGVGGCLVLNGRLWQGDRLGFVGEIGHMVIRHAGPQCVCGLRGCLEAHASGRALVEGVGEAVSGGRLSSGPLFNLYRSGGLDAAAVYRFASEGDPLALSLFRRMGEALGQSLAGLFTFLGIRHAVVGGGVSAGWDLFIGPLRESLVEHASMPEPGDMIVLRSRLGDDAALIGAARLAGEAVGATGRVDDRP
ncbi:MAG: ROK family protein [Acidobacteriota bacterium]